MNVTVENIWKEFHKELKGLIRKKVRNDGIADDILQDVFLKINSNSDKISEARSMRQYIYRIASNTINDHFRKEAKKTKLESEYPQLTSDDSSSLNDKIAECCIKPFIAQLTEKYQVALIRSEFDNISQKELAKELDISYSGAKSRVQRGKEKLKDLLVACCNLSSDTYGNLSSSDSIECACD